MDRAAASRLRLLGFVVLGICVALLLAPIFVEKALKYDDAIAGTLAIGIGLLLLAELAPLIKSLKAGGVEIELLDSVSGKFNALETRVATLEIAARHPERTPTEVEHLIAEKPRPPGLQEEPKYRDDPQKGRFGGKSERDGFILSAAFRNVSKNFVEVMLTVMAPPEAGLQSGDCVDFYLHHSFDPDVVTVVFKSGKAELNLLVYGGFTVGAWVACRSVALELDLASVRGAPRVIREL